MARCTLTGKKKGSAKLEITLASGLTKTVTVKVQKTAVKTSKVKVAEKKLTVKKGEKASLKATVAPFTSAQKLTYTSSNKKVATVSKNGVVTGEEGRHGKDHRQVRQQEGHSDDHGAEDKDDGDHRCREHHGKEGQDLQPEGKGRSEEQ